MGEPVLQNLPGPNRTPRLYYGKEFPAKDLLAGIAGLEPLEVIGPEEIEDRGSICLLDRHLRERGDGYAWKRAGGEFTIIIGETPDASCDFLVPEGWPAKFLLKALEGALREWDLLVRKHVLTTELETKDKRLFQLTHIGLALSAETDLGRLLTLILAEGRNWGCCDAASLFLVDREGREEPRLVFKLTQNDSVSCPFEEKHFPLDTRSIAGFVAVTGEILNIPDVYQIPPETPYEFNRSFDQSIHYRTRSMLTIPMKNHKQEVLGVLQFINRKTSPDIKLTTREVTESHTLPFSREIGMLLEALASQAAVAVGNTVLIDRIHQLFEGFVTAAVTAIEQRDPTTSGHSLRVAEYTTSLAEVVPRSDLSRFRTIRFNGDQIREIRYASLLHDFGKVGVREPVLAKPKKLPDRGLDLIWHRFALFKERLRRKNFEARVEYLERNGRKDYRHFSAHLDRLLTEELERFSQFYREIEQANEPSILDEEISRNLNQIHDLEPFVVEERKLPLLNDGERLALSVRKGSLTEAERLEIESHVVHTFNFLKQIPWTKELSQIPTYAVAHHEKLNGSGYPFGRMAKEIPLPAKMMTIADIYDALTASDRPYKKSLPAEKALEILESDAKKHLLDTDLVDIFIQAKIYEHSPAANMPVLEYESYMDGLFQRTVCDYDLFES